jgi:hypothetical protein
MHHMFHAIRSPLFGSVLVFALSVQSAVVYRWVDENGRTHVSDVVPEQYRKSATRIDSSRSEVSPERRQQAERAAARNRALAEETATRRQSAQAIEPPAVASRPAATKRPTQGVTDSTDCATWRGLYRESMECFAPFRTRAEPQRLKHLRIAIRFPVRSRNVGPSANRQAGDRPSVERRFGATNSPVAA